MKPPDPVTRLPIRSERFRARVKGTIAELRPAAGKWIHALANRLRTGFVLVIDYGFSRDLLLSAHRTEGTFACYRAHRRDARPLEEPGEKDITAHVDFTALAETAREQDFKSKASPISIITSSELRKTS